jgi:hypothetical protein
LTNNPMHCFAPLDRAPVVPRSSATTCLGNDLSEQAEIS